VQTNIDLSYPAAVNSRGTRARRSRKLVKSLSFAESHLFLWRIQQLREEETTSPAQIESSENSESRAMRLWRQGGSVRFLCETSLLPRVRLGWGPAREHGKHMTEREKRKRERERERQRERERERERGGREKRNDERTNAFAHCSRTAGCYFVIRV